MPHVKELPEIKRVYLIGIGGTYAGLHQAWLDSLV